MFPLINANEDINLSISVRFSDTQNWIYTLYPYKEFFNNSVKNVRFAINKEKDLRPIGAIAFSYPYYGEENLMTCNIQN